MIKCWPKFNELYFKCIIYIKQYYIFKDPTTSLSYSQSTSLKDLIVRYMKYRPKAAVYLMLETLQSICSINMVGPLSRNHTSDCQLNCDCDWRLAITFQPIRAKQSPIEISDCRLSPYQTKDWDWDWIGI